MHDAVVTQIWMGGVMAAMAVFGLIAVIGWRRRR
jgi:uncharacterized protein (TIGR03382 family)